MRSRYSVTVVNGPGLFRSDGQDSRGGSNVDQTTVLVPVFYTTASPAMAPRLDLWLGSL